MGNTQGSAMVQDGDLVAKVMLPDGSIDEFTYAVEVNKLMSLYPDNIVVHCSSVEPLSGHLNGVSVMELGDFLVLGQSYILYPIPPQFKQDLRSQLSRSCSLPQVKCAPPPISGKKDRWAEVKKMMTEKKQRKLERAKSAVREIFHSRKSKAPTHRTKDVFAASVVTADKNESSKNMDSQYEEVEKKFCSFRFLLDDPFACRQELDCIPESPLGYHDRPQSPYVLQQRVSSWRTSSLKSSSSSRSSSLRSSSSRTSSLKSSSSSRSLSQSSRFAPGPENDFRLEQSPSHPSCLGFFSYHVEENV